MNRLDKQQACQLFIEQEIERGLAEGKSKNSIGYEIAEWIKDLFNAEVKPDTIKKRAFRHEQRLAGQMSHDDHDTPSLEDFTPEQKEIVRLFNEAKKAKRESKKAAIQEKKIAAAEGFKNTDSITLHKGDFREVCKNIEDSSIDLVLTDLPYPKEYLDLWEPLSEISNRVLKDGGYLVAYSGQLYIDQVLPALCKHMNYVWTFSMRHVGPTQLVHARNVVCAWKPIFVFRKGTPGKFDQTLVDEIDIDKSDKALHEWQQGIITPQIFIDKLTMPNDVVLDVCAGAGTFIEAANILRRRAIGIEMDDRYFEIMKGRLNE